MPNKPKSYGIKVFALVDARTFYLLKFEIYTGIQPEGPFRVSNSAHDIVLRLVEPIKRTGRNITTDNWYTSVPLALSLLDMNLTLVGTLRKNKGEIPIEFLPNKTREVYSSLFGFTKQLTICSYVPAKSKSVVVLSTMHNDSAIDQSEFRREKKKPEIITFYNTSKGGVDSNDQLCSNYNVGRRTNRWPLAIFYHILNITGINSYIIFKQNSILKGNTQPIVRRNFLRNLGHQLVQQHVIRRSLSSVHHRNLKFQIKCYLESQGVAIFEEKNGTEDKGMSKKRKRCGICPSTRDNKYSAFCCKCGDYICKNHTYIICSNCKDCA